MATISATQVARYAQLHSCCCSLNVQHYGGADTAGMLNSQAVQKLEAPSTASEQLLLGPLRAQAFLPACFVLVSGLVDFPPRRGLRYFIKCLD